MAKWFLLLLFWTNTVIAVDVDIKGYYQETPVWVVQQQGGLPKTIPKEQLKSGVFYALYDRQYYISDTQFSYFQHLKMQAVNTVGVEEISQVEISFQPSYQNIHIHEVVIIRKGIRIDKMDTAKVSLIQQELDRFIYNGESTLSLVIDDVRVGDTLEYKFSREGINPVYGGNVALTLYTQWRVPIGYQSIRVKWDRKDPLYHHERGDEPLDLIETRTESGTEFTLQQWNSSALRVEDQVPPRYNPYQRVVFSNTKNWHEVASWAHELYSDVLSQPADEQIRAAVEEIEKSAVSQTERFMLALDFVQENIRYFGIEFGVNSHRPSPASETLTRRYGDCKDKSVLLITLLSHLGIEAFPVLVHSDNTLDKNTPAAVTAFDHVVVKATVDAEPVWIDPTRNFQANSLAGIEQVSLDYGLVVLHDQFSLSEINKPRRLQQTVVERFEYSGANSPMGLDVSVRYEGAEAESQQHYIQRNSLEDIGNQYKQYYGGIYDNVELVEPVLFNVDTDHGVVESKERYRLLNPWAEASEGYEMDFYAKTVANKLSLPDEVERKSPFNLQKGTDVSQSIHVLFPKDKWAFDDEKQAIHNTFFEFDFFSEFDGELLKLVYQLKILVDEVPPENMAVYKQAVDQVDNYLSYGIIEYYPESEDEEIHFHYDDLAVLFYLSWLLGGIIAIVVFYKRVKKIDEKELSLFVVHPIKFVFLAISTFGLYICYWVYMQYRYFAVNKTLGGLSWLKAIFYRVMIIPFVKHLVEATAPLEIFNRRFGSVYPLLMLISLLVLIIVEVTTSLSGLYIVDVLLFIPLVLHVAKHASTTRLRIDIRPLHIVVSILLLPGILLGVGQEFHLFPSERAAKADQIWSFQKKRWLRQKVYSPNEKLLMFYSDSVMDYNYDGNGITTRGVFSYWFEGKERYQMYSSYEQLLSLEITDSGNSFSAATIAVTMDDDYFTLFVHHKDRLAFLSAACDAWQEIDTSAQLSSDGILCKPSL